MNQTTNPTSNDLQESEEKRLLRISRSKRHGLIPGFNRTAQEVLDGFSDILSNSEDPDLRQEVETEQGLLKEWSKQDVGSSSSVSKVTDFYSEEMRTFIDKLTLEQKLPKETCLLPDVHEELLDALNEEREAVAGLRAEAAQKGIEAEDDINRLARSVISMAQSREDDDSMMSGAGASSGNTT